MSARKFAADKLLWETLERWKRSGSESDRVQFLKTVPFFDRLSKRIESELRSSVRLTRRLARATGEQR